MCLTCSTTDVCLTCQIGLVFNDVGQCMDCVGNNMIINNTCKSCQNKCNGCELMPSQCLNCSINRFNPPVCRCQDGKLKYNMQDFMKSIYNVINALINVLLANKMDNVLNVRETESIPQNVTAQPQVCQEPILELLGAQVNYLIY